MTLCDTAPLVALLIQRDQNHARCSLLARTLRKPLVTTWPCIAEAMYLLGQYGGYAAQEALWELIHKDVLILHECKVSEIHRMRLLMRQYADTPMDLADASLVAVAESLQLKQIFTLDRDFFIYRLANGSALEVVP